METWFVEPVWQNYSSMYREAITAKDAKTGMELSHHLTASLYFSISALEAFLNEHMQKHLSDAGRSAEIHDKLRKATVAEKLKKWPVEILGTTLTLRKGTLDTLLSFKKIRDDLTHVKHPVYDTYEDLEGINPDRVIDVVAEYFAQYHEAKGDHFRYWLWGWNYLNPRHGEYAISLINDQQFVHSVRYLGFAVDSSSPRDSKSWQTKYMSGYAGYREVAKFLNGLDQCEPKFDEFPYQPKLCRRWWLSEHHGTCGHVTREAIDYAVNYDFRTGTSTTPPSPSVVWYKRPWAAYHAWDSRMQELAATPEGVLELQRIREMATKGNAEIQRRIAFRFTLVEYIVVLSLVDYTRTLFQGLGWWLLCGVEAFLAAGLWQFVSTYLLARLFKEFGWKDVFKLRTALSLFAVMAATPLIFWLSWEFSTALQKAQFLP